MYRIWNIYALAALYVLENQLSSLFVMTADHKDHTAAPLVACYLALMCQACPPG
jgi:hypothetical protein